MISQVHLTEGLPIDAFVPSQAPVHWCAVSTRSRHEKKSASELREKGVQAFLPTLHISRRWSDRNKIVEEPLFPGYVFVRMARSVETRLSVLKASGVVGFVGEPGWGTPIPDKQVEDLQTLVSQNVTLGLHLFLREGQRVRIRGGCLDGIEGILLECLSDRDLVISVEPIQRSVIVRITDYDVEPL